MSGIYLKGLYYLLMCILVIRTTTVHLFTFKYPRILNKRPDYLLISRGTEIRIIKAFLADGSRPGDTFPYCVADTIWLAAVCLVEFLYSVIDWCWLYVGALLR